MLAGLESWRAGVNIQAGFPIDSILEASEPSKPQMLEAWEASWNRILEVECQGSV